MRGGAKAYRREGYARAARRRMYPCSHRSPLCDGGGSAQRRAIHRLHAGQYQERTRRRVTLAQRRVGATSAGPTYACGSQMALVLLWRIAIVRYRPWRRWWRSRRALRARRRRALLFGLHWRRRRWLPDACATRRGGHHYDGRVHAQAGTPRVDAERAHRVRPSARAELLLLPATAPSTSDVH